MTERWPVSAAPTLDAISADPERVRDLPRKVLVDLALRCATVQSAIAVALAATPADITAGPDKDQLLPAHEAARLLGRKPDWLYRHAAELPFTVREPGHQPRFSSKGIQRYIERQVARQAAGKGA